MFCLACGSFGFYAAAQTPHHAPEGFRNNYPHPDMASFWRWKWAQLRHGVPELPPGGWKFPNVKTDAAALRANTTHPTVTWIGHAAFLLQLAGRNILVDPQFADRASPVAFAGPRRIVPLPIDVPEAVQVRADLRAARAIGMHWGTFEGLADEAMDEPPAELARQRVKAGLTPSDFDVMAIGETRPIEAAGGAR